MARSSAQLAGGCNQGFGRTVFSAKVLTREEYTNEPIQVVGGIYSLVVILLKVLAFYSLLAGECSQS